MPWQNGNLSFSTSARFFEFVYKQMPSCWHAASSHSSLCFIIALVCTPRSSLISTCSAVSYSKGDTPSSVIPLRQPLYPIGDADGNPIVEVRESRDEGPDGAVGHRVPHKVEIYVLGSAPATPRQRHQDPILDCHPIAHARRRRLGKGHVLADTCSHTKSRVAFLALITRLHLSQAIRISPS